MTRKHLVRQTLGASLLLAGACSHFHRSGSTAAAPKQTPAASKAAPAPSKPAPSKPAPAKATSSASRSKAPPRAANAPLDANIAAIVLAESNTDISYARLAPNRARSADVKAYAAAMMADHAGVNRAVNDVLVRAKLDPEDNKMSLDFRDESAARRDELRNLNGHAFDSAYVANEVTYQTKFLAAIDANLLPNAMNSDLKQLLTSLRPAVAAHLAHAQQVQAALATR